MSGAVPFLLYRMGIGKAAVYKHIPDHFPNDVGVVGGMAYIGGKALNLGAELGAELPGRAGSQAAQDLAIVEKTAVLAHQGWHLLCGKHRFPLVHDQVDARTKLWMLAQGCGCLRPSRHVGQARNAADRACLV